MRTRVVRTVTSASQGVFIINVHQELLTPSNVLIDELSPSCLAPGHSPPTPPPQQKVFSGMSASGMTWFDFHFSRAVLNRFSNGKRGTTEQKRPHTQPLAHGQVSHSITPPPPPSAHHRKKKGEKESTSHAVKNRMGVTHAERLPVSCSYSQPTSKTEPPSCQPADLPDGRHVRAHT